ncbi:MAG: hypothetical protein QOF61_1379 [Acidobacteriota bacterium]|nr:hypothetical protein [Acidobacteriota bacterium]
MPARAFVIAIEDYSRGNFLPSLPGCNKDAETFIAWLREKKGVAPADILCCAGDGFKGRTTGTTSAEIIAELGKCVTNWADKTDEFYFYFSGHGFSYSTSPWEKSVDVLVASDFTDLATGGRACLPLSEIKTKLWKSLGPRHHYYFIDACRNQIPSDALSLAGTGLGFPTSQLGTPTVYKMFSTAQGATSKTTSGFTPLLVRGLSGGGRAKGLRAGRMFVIFDLLCEYMKKSLQTSGQDVDYDREGSGDGYLLELKPVPQTKCEINVKGAAANDNFTLTVRDIKGLGKEQQFKGASFEVALFPDDYFLELKHPSASVVRKAPPPEDPVDLYDPCVLQFELRLQAAQTPAAKKSVKAAKKASKTTKGGGASKQGGKGATPGGIALVAQSEKAAPTLLLSATLQVKAAAAPHTEVEVLSLKTGDVLRSKGDFNQEVAPGEYVVKLRERGITVSRREMTIKAGESKTLNMLARPKDKVRDAILKTVKAGDASGASVFSETLLGPLASQDLGLWLSLFGASRILGEPGELKKLERLPLATFADVKKNEACVYVLAGFEKSNGQFGVGLSSGAQVEWGLLDDVKGLPKIYERRLPAAPGAHLLSLKIPKQSPVTFAVHCLPNRATLVTFAEDKEGRLTFHQSILPIRHLQKYLEPTVRSYLGQNMLGVVRTMTLAQSQFARKRSVQEQLKANDMGVWNDLVNHKWLDPVMALIAAYDVIRHGTIEQAKRLLTLVNSNLRKHFEGMADVEAIAKLLGTQWKLPQSAPLLFDGVLAFDDTQEKSMLPLSPDKLDYKSPWTAWRGAVNDFDLPAAPAQKARSRAATKKSDGRSRKASGSVKRSRKASGTATRKRRQ